MNDVKHTAAPWEYTSEMATHISAGGHNVIVDVPKPNGMSEEEWRSNRALIKHAPELLALVKEYAEDAECGGGGGENCHNPTECWHCRSVALAKSIQQPAAPKKYHPPLDESIYGTY